MVCLYGERHEIYVRFNSNRGPRYSASVCRRDGSLPAQPGAETFTLGEFRITSLRDAVNVVPNDGRVFGADVGPQAVAGVLTKAGQTTDAVTLSVDALLAQRGHEAILIDTGLGPTIPGALAGSLLWLASHWRT